MKRKIKWVLAPIALALLGLLAYVAAGPYLAINGIRNLVASDNPAELWRFVDFQQLHASLAPQLQERLARQLIDRMGPGEKPRTIGEIVQLIGSPAIDAIASPAGIERLLRSDVLRPASAGAAAAAGDPLDRARTRYESLSLFTATVDNANGKQVVFEFRRDGLDWKLTGLRLPED